MAAKQSVRWLVLGVALTALAGCDAVNDRLDKFGKLTGDVIKQISGESEEVDPLTSAPLEARALFGTVQTAVALPEQSLDELLQTQSFFAVGSVIAMPKEEMTEPVVEPESFDLVAADPGTPHSAEADALNSSDAAPPESAASPAGPPVTEAAPKPLLAEPVPAPAPAPAPDTK